jgi:hypothetical protein
VALKSFELRYSDEVDHWVNGERIKLEVSSTEGHRSCIVKASAWWHSRSPELFPSGYDFQGTIQVLVIADLEDQKMIK